MKSPPASARSDLFEIDAEVAAALAARRPVVALESAALSRGFPHALAIEVEQRVEQAVRDKGAVPALLFVRDGRIRVGGGADDVAAMAGNRRIGRASRGNLLGVMQAPGYAVTTVSASMMICKAVGIPLLAVGGIGGVHRGAFQPADGAATVSLDVSPDLQELARTDVVVVASGPKSFLDLAATMQWLETRGVPVVTLGGQSVPGYFSVDSAEPSPIVVDSVEDGARLLARHFALDCGTGLLFCVAVPAADAIPREEVEAAIREASAGVVADGISGGPVTAAVLARMAARTGDRTLAAQAAMSVRNAEVAAALAGRLAAVAGA